MANAVEQQVRKRKSSDISQPSRLSLARGSRWNASGRTVRPAMGEFDFANNKIRIEHSFNHYDQLKGPKSEAGKRAIGQTREIYAALSDLALLDYRRSDGRRPRFRSYRRKTITTRIQDRWARDMTSRSKSRRGLASSSCPNRGSRCVQTPALGFGATHRQGRHLRRRCKIHHPPLSEALVRIVPIGQ